jgi:hypothetical protein
MAVLKRMLPTAIAIAVGVFVLAAVFTSDPRLDALGAYFIDTAVVIAAFALFLGLINVLRVHARKIRERGPGRLYSFVLLAAMLIVLAIGLPPLSDRPSVQWIIENIQVPIQASLSALLAFFVITAAYRLLRLRSFEAVLMLIVTLLVLAGQVTVGLLPILPDIQDWILAVPAMAGVRGILLGVALGAILTGVRILLGVERPYGD